MGRRCRGEGGGRVGGGQGGKRAYTDHAARSPERGVENSGIPHLGHAFGHVGIQVAEEGEGDVSHNDCRHSVTHGAHSSFLVVERHG